MATFPRSCSTFATTAITFVLVVTSGFSCTATQAFIVTGESVDSLGDSFERADDLMKRGLRDGKVSNATFRDWTNFSTAFDLTYGEALDAWKTAQRVKNAVDEKRWGDVLADLGAKLARFYVKLKEANLLPPGAP